MMSDELRQQQASIDHEIMSALVEATPDTWHSAHLDITFQTASNVDSVELEITNPDGLHELVQPTDRLTLAARNLSLFFKRAGLEATSARYDIRETTPGSWHMKAAFSYAP